jgi:2-hydroxy-3-keto-5-methylthiopentenyl-1-phosphate phosphatase
MIQQACVHHGWGRWKDIARNVPSRSRSQVKSHAQKFQLVQPKQKEILDMLHKERSRQVKDEMKEFEMIAIALLNLKHPPNT